MYSFFPYAGGKRQLARFYPLPTHKTIIEPFAGSAGYACHHPKKDVRLFDINPVICEIWDYLIHVSATEFMRLPTEFDSVDDLLVPQGAKFLIGFWVQRGSSSPGRKPSTWYTRGRNEWPAKTWSEQTKGRLALQLDKIRHWKIYNKAFHEIDNEVATWYVDAPYQAARSRYVFNKINYVDLAEFCKTRIGQTIVAEKDGANWLPFRAFRDARNMGRNRHAEVVWTRTSTEWIWMREAEHLLAQLAATRDIPSIATTEQTVCRS